MFSISKIKKALTKLGLSEKRIDELFSGDRSLISHAVGVVTARKLLKETNNSILTALAVNRKMINAGIIPSAERIKEYLISSSLRENYDKNLQKVFCCMAAVLRLGEERQDFINPEFKKIIASLESENFTDGIKN